MLALHTTEKVKKAVSWLEVQLKADEGVESYNLLSISSLKLQGKQVFLKFNTGHYLS